MAETKGLSASVISEVSNPRDRNRLRLMGLLLESGCCQVLKQWMADYGALLSNSTDRLVRERYTKFREEAEKAFEIEVAHGVGSLLKLDHSMVKTLARFRINGSSPAIGPEEIKAAEQYRLLQRQVQVPAE